MLPPISKNTWKNTKSSRKAHGASHTSAFQHINVHTHACISTSTCTYTRVHINKYMYTYTCAFTSKYQSSACSRVRFTPTRKIKHMQSPKTKQHGHSSNENHIKSHMSVEKTRSTGRTYLLMKPRFSRSHVHTT